MVDLLTIKLTLTHQKDQYSGIHRARARPHHQAIQWSESHGGVNAASSLDSCYGATIPQVASDNSERFCIFPQQLSGAPGAVLMIDTVESVAPNALLQPLVGTGINCRRGWHLAMKA